MIAPQRCPNRKCKADLRDPTVPPRYRRFWRQFTRATVPEDAPVSDTHETWVCPECGHRWVARR